MRTTSLPLLLLALAACSDRGDAVLASADGRWRVVHVVEVDWQEDAARAAMAAALERLPRIDLVFAHDDAMAVGAATAAQQQGRQGIRFVGIGALPQVGREHLANGRLDATIERPTCAGAAIDLALLACQGVELPRRIDVGTRVWTKDNLAAGGAGKLSPGEFMLASLRAQHAAALTTTPAHDQVFRVGMAECGGDDPWLRARRAELAAWASRYPQLQFDHPAAAGDAEQQGRIVRGFVAQGYHAILIAPADPLVLAAPCQEAIQQGIDVIVLGPELGADGYTCFVGSDDAALGREAGEEIRRLLPQGGAIVAIQGLMTSTAAQRRHQGFVEALGLAEVH